ncbi:hypothetical protein, partial [Henriciella pelagia]|uniref:hypothetical protein n=1 Tax=Henriciella pelagia TaxID=1977912 RepID=UPI003514A7E9
QVLKITPESVKFGARLPDGNRATDDGILGSRPLAREQRGIVIAAFVPFCEKACESGTSNSEGYTRYRSGNT